MAHGLNTITGIAALALVFGAGPAFAQYSTSQNPQGRDGSNETTTSANPTTTADQDFAMKAAQGGMAEVKLGQLAEQNGSNQAVKDFGRRMVQDHSKADNQLKNVASTQNVALPNELDKTEQATYERLSKLSGEAFDRAYARDMVKDHSKDVSEFRGRQRMGRMKP